MEKEPFKDGKVIIKKIEDANEEAYFVGGCVRDLLLNRQIKDIDIATSASPEKIQKIFKKVIPVGIEHGTVIVRYKNHSYEVTTFRLDGHYTDKRHPDTVQFIHKIDEDLKRRDFTINALAMDRQGNIIDLFAGQRDLELKKIRTVGNGYERFSEDALRMIRAVRFASQLGFLIEEETLKHIITLKENIESVAIERITSEFSKLFAGDFVNKGIYYLQKTKIYEHLPILSKYRKLIDQIPYLHHPLKSFGEVIALLNNIEPNVSIETWVKEWRCSNRIKREAMELTAALAYYKEKGLDQWLVYRLPDRYYAGFLRLIRNLFPKDSFDLTCLKKIKRNLPIQSKDELAVTGSDIINIYPHIVKGPWIRNMITTIEKKVVFRQINNNKNDLKEWIKCNPPKTN